MTPSTLGLCVMLVWPNVQAQARHAGVPEQLAQAVIMVESGCDWRAHSDSGAIGLFQVLPFWAKTAYAAHCGNDSLYSAVPNICFGVHILRHYERRCRGSWACALRKYSGNAPGYAQKVQRWMQVLKRCREGRRCPFREERHERSDESRLGAIRALRRTGSLRLVRGAPDWYGVRSFGRVL